MREILPDDVRSANVRRGAAHGRAATPLESVYVANGPFGRSCDGFGFRGRPQRDKDHGWTQLSAQMHHARKASGGHDLQSLAALQARIGERPAGLAGLEDDPQEPDLHAAELRTRFAWESGGCAARHFASWARPHELLANAIAVGARRRGDAAGGQTGGGVGSRGQCVPHLFLDDALASAWMGSGKDPAAELDRVAPHDSPIFTASSAP